ncbi:MAG: hypothetical protein ACE5GY_07085 [Thermodesulfobacteriota bacterium]
MSNFDTANAIEDNLHTVLEALGINFTREAYDNEAAISAALLPHGQIFYLGEDFAYNHGEKPLYAEIRFLIRVVLRERDAADIGREQRRWVHLIRDNITIDALNIGDLAGSKLVSRASTDGVDTENNAPRAAIRYRVSVRYREI